MLLIVVLCMILTVLARPVAAWATSAPPTVIIECDNPVQKKQSSVVPVLVFGHDTGVN